jgi:hypothetical protein
MGIVDNLCSPGWEKDLTISVVSLDRKYEFKVAICPKSLPTTFWILRRFGYKDFIVTRKSAEGDIDVVCRVGRSPLVQVCISSTPGLDGRRAPIKDILGEKVVAMINSVETDSSGGDVADLIDEIGDKELSDFVASEVRFVGIVIVVG